jgi:hypothetical protein
MLKPAEVQRDKEGFWSHPDIPDWGGKEAPTPEEHEEWQFKNLVQSHFVKFEHDASEALSDRYYKEDDLTAVCDWSPSIDAESAFLFSIYDSEEGPAAWFLVPIAIDSVLAISAIKALTERVKEDGFTTQALIYSHALKLLEQQSEFVKEAEKLVLSEIGDFCSGFGCIGHPETPDEIQKALSKRITNTFAWMQTNDDNTTPSE